MLRAENLDLTTVLDAIADIIDGRSKDQLLAMKKDIASQGSESIYFDEVKKRQAELEEIEPDTGSSDSE